MKTAYAHHHLRVHSDINSAQVCSGSEQLLQWGAEVNVIQRRHNGRVLIQWNDGVKNWHGWTYKESLAKSLDEIF